MNLWSRLLISFELAVLLTVLLLIVQIVNGR